MTGIDVDEESLETAWVNRGKLELTNIDFIRMDLRTLNVNMPFDTVVMNPPFGTRNAGIDTAFVEKAMDNSKVVYSLHKTNTREHFVRLAKAKNFTFQVVAELKYDIPKTFKHQKERSKDIAVDLLRFERMKTHTPAPKPKGEGEREGEETVFNSFGEVGDGEKES